MRLLAVLAICFSLLVTVGAQDRIPRADRAKMRETRETMRSLHLDLTTYHQINGNYPEDLKTLVDDEVLESVPKDAWGRDFNYTHEKPEFRLTSYGSDGKPGGKLAAADIVWTPNGEHRELTADEKAAREQKLEEQRFEATKLLARQRMVVVGGEVVSYRRDEGKWPAELGDCVRDGTDTEDEAINACFRDPFGHEFGLRLLPNENFAVVCWGTDGEEGGTGRDGDFVVTERDVRKRYNAMRDSWGYDPWSNDWQIENLANDVERYKERFGKLPEELGDLTRGGQGPDGPIPAIRNSIPHDQWGNEYVLVKLNEDEFYVAGLGKDGLEGGVKDNADVIYPMPGRVEENVEEFEMPIPEQDDDEILHEVAVEMVNDIIAKANEYHAAEGSYPATLEDLAEQFPGDTVPLDPWENAFVYTLTKDAEDAVTGFTVTCYGSDGAEGGDDWAADIVLNQGYEQQ